MAHSAERKPSPIRAMHKRYEETMREYVVIEKAESAAKKDKDENAAFALRNGAKALCYETDALRVAILHQVPDSWVEAMILQYHIVNAYDVQTGCDKPLVAEQQALSIAIDTLFDFMCCEIEQDHGELGSSFQDGAIRAFHQRRNRTGIVEA